VVGPCYTSDGRLGGCINQTTKIWDIAPPYLIVKEAGGIFTDINGNDIDFSFNESDYEKNFTMVCSNKILHAKIMELIRKVI
jgi:fructose-1,6-bisphosphatase/inositol monophosphatase family enzyme